MRVYVPARVCMCCLKECVYMGSLCVCVHVACTADEIAMATEGTFDKFREAARYLGLGDYAAIPSVSKAWRNGVYKNGWATNLFPRHHVCRRIHRATSAKFVERAVEWIRWDKSLRFNNQWPEYANPEITTLGWANFRCIMDTCVYYDVPDLLKIVLTQCPTMLHLGGCPRTCDAARILMNSYVKGDLVYMPCHPNCPWREQWLDALQKEGRKRNREEDVNMLIARPTKMLDMLFPLMRMSSRLGGFGTDPRDCDTWRSWRLDVPYDRDVTIRSCTYLDRGHAWDKACQNFRSRDFNYAGPGMEVPPGVNLRFNPPRRGQGPRYINT